MKRRSFLRTTGAVSAGLISGVRPIPAPAPVPNEPGSGSGEWRDLFPRMKKEVFLNAAAGTPLSSFSEEAVDRYLEYWKFGHSEGRREVLADTLSSIRAEFADLIGADESEIALVSNTKEGEQIVLDSMKPWEDEGNVVSNVFHFGGSLHNYEGHRRAGRDVRIVRSRGWELPTDLMIESMDERTSLVAVTQISNVNGRLEDLAALSRAAHARGAYVYADIIQAAGIQPIDVRTLDIDFAACSAYKWLYGPHGVGFLYVRKELQASVLQDRLFPGHSRLMFPPWTDVSVDEDLSFAPRTDATRYEPGHHNYLGYAAVLAGLRFLREIGVEKVRDYSIELADLLRRSLDDQKYPCISPDPMASPIIAFEKGGRDIIPALQASNIVLSVSPRQFRVSPTIFNNEDDILALVRTLHAA